jgi:DNA-binding transcriptional MocR family regulator
MSDRRRREVIDALVEHGAFLVEDDAARDLDFATLPFRPLALDDPDGHIVYLRSLTKGVAPSLRIAGLAARGPALLRLRAAQSVQAGFVSTPLQYAAVEVLTAPGWPRHIAGVRRQLARRRDALVTALGRYLPEWHIPHLPTCGLHLWTRLPDDTEEGDVLGAAASVGVRLTAGAAYYPAEPVAAHLRLSYAANPPGPCGRDRPAWRSPPPGKMGGAWKFVTRCPAMTRTRPRAGRHGLAPPGHLCPPCPPNHGNRAGRGSHREPMSASRGW